jgi:hypothetical protein
MGLGILSRVGFDVEEEGVGREKSEAGSQNPEAGNRRILTSGFWILGLKTRAL